MGDPGHQLGVDAWEKQKAQNDGAQIEDAQGHDTEGHTFLGRPGAGNGEEHDQDVGQAGGAEHQSDHRADHGQGTAGLDTDGHGRVGLGQHLAGGGNGLVRRQILDGRHHCRALSGDQRRHGLFGRGDDVEKRALAYRKEGQGHQDNHGAPEKGGLNDLVVQRGLHSAKNNVDTH